MTLDPPTPDDVVLASDRAGTFDERVALGVAAISGAFALAAGAAPTGSSSVDAVLVFVGAAFATWAVARAAWMVLAAIGGIALAVGLAPLPVVLAFIAVVATVTSPTLARRMQSSWPPWVARSVMHSVAAACVVNSLLRSELGVFHGLSAVVGVGVAAIATTIGVAARPRRVRRLVALAGVLIIVATGAAVALAAVALTSARADLAQGTQDARQSVQAVNAGRYVEGAERLDNAADRFAAVDERLSGGLLAPGEWIPGLAQNLRAVRNLADGASSTLESAAGALGEVDPTKLRLIEGALDIEEISRVEEPLRGVRGSLLDFRADIDAVDSPWLVAPLQTELAKITVELDDGLPRLDNAIRAVELAPGLLGGDGRRNYLVMFTTPAEARGLGGFVGNYAHVVADDGRITVVDFGRRQRLDRILTESGGGRCDACASEMLLAYGARGLTLGPDGGVADQVWASLTEPSHFPYVAEAAASLFPQSGGTELDGVVVADPYTVQALMSFTGPIPVREFDRRVLPRQAAQFIIADQYLLTDDRPERVDALESLALGVIERLLTDSAPTPARLADALSPMITERRLMMWSSDPVENELFSEIGLLGALPAPTDEGFSATVTNEGGSKIDAFLERSIDVSVQPADDIDGAPAEQLVAEVVLTNTAPDSGLPSYVIGNVADLPLGTSQMLVRLYGPDRPVSVTVDGQEATGQDFTEVGWAGREVRIVIAAGGSSTLRVTYPPVPVEEDTDGGDTPRTVEPSWLQPLAVRQSS